MKIVISMLAALILLSCATVPITGRKQFRLIPSDEILATSFQQYGDFLAENEVVGSSSQQRLVNTVGQNIRLAVEQYVEEEGYTNLLKGYEWEFNLVDNDQVNAWCMPGGKVVVYTGILPITQDEAGLAVVMGHEIAHALAKHGNERMSQMMLAQMGGMALQTALEEKPEETQQLWMQVYGIGANIGGLLPFSRLHESEADHLGLIFMAMAGYDPSTAVAFWQRMSAAGGGAPIEFLSTHPSSERRISDLQKLLPEAMAIYEASDQKRS